MIDDALPRSPAAPSSLSHTVAESRTSRTRRALRWLAAPLLGALALSASACGEAEPPSRLRPAPSEVPVAHAARPACTEGAVEPCSVMLGEHAGVVSCYEGTRTCIDGALSECTDGRGFEVAAASPVGGGAGLRPLAFGPDTACTNNPCNRYCREFIEVPEAGLVPAFDESAPPLSSWVTGSISDYPAEWVAAGLREPCSVAGDCQYDSVCTDPSLGSCTHSVCAAGEALAPGCNRCADSVCALDPECCATAPACAHDPCEVGSGAPLEPACDTCVQAVCAAHPECCSVTWNEACVGYVEAECAPSGQSCQCPGGSLEADGACHLPGDTERDWFLARDACSAFGDDWRLMEVSDEAANALAQSLVGAGGFESAWLGALTTGTDEWSWQSIGTPFFIHDASGGQLQPGYSFAAWAPAEPELGAIGRGLAIGADGLWRDAPLGFELGYVCAGPKNRLGPKRSPFEWGAECVALAAEACGVSCPEQAPLGFGACTARVPAALEAGCAEFDLALGATCAELGVPQIPVCNHGQAEAPAGLRLRHLDSAQLGSASPDFSEAGTCVVTEPIPPGRCVMLTECAGLEPHRALVINPADGGEHPAECRTDDNWSVYEPVACGPAVCEAGVHSAARVKARGCRIELDNPLGVDAALARVTVGTGVPEPGCGPNELRWGASCYFFATDAATWDSAQVRCRDRGTGWDLVALNSPAENAWVRAQTDAARDLQIGLNDQAVEGEHVWSNGSCVGFTAWDATTLQPNNAPPGSQQCARMTALSGAGWADKACNDGNHPYACEGPLRDARGGCASGQLAGPDGSCYAFDATARGFDEAESACAALGAGWRLPVIDDAATNHFVTSIIDCTPAWLSNPPGALGSWVTGESVDLSQEPYIDALGAWHASDTGEARATLCQGPTTLTGAPTLTQVASADGCVPGDEHFYFTGNATAPEALHLCPATCDAAAAVQGRRVEVEIGCAPPRRPALESAHVERYGDFAGGLCPQGAPQWDFLYYDAVTPADSRIELEVRAALSEEELALAPFVPVASAHALPTDTQSCESPLVEGCPVDIFEALGTADLPQQAPVLELRARLLPGSSGEAPLLRDWTVRFSCPPAL